MKNKLYGSSILTTVILSYYLSYHFNRIQKQDL
ncbi:hypothetical protein CAEBREN_01305 [Caenorhabditis brenneri]|uniref:Uncharacterized protein n=1 Tax=Caenorhabditis brenneri TaxID=135651 RepID=G0MV92_CAEBE|nr:hypothetical protein CAEBREN_01305 [Caenorhabditis brenneri]